MTSIRRALALGLLLLTYAPLAGQEEEPLSRRQAELQLRAAQRWMRDVYSRKISFSRGYPKPKCDTRTGADCFQGEYECPMCLWKEDRSELTKLVQVYDSIGRLMLRTPPGVSVARLNWLAGQRVGMRVHRGELAEARVAARECRAEFWWCEALSALVDHRSGDSRSAEARMQRVLRAMPQGRACYWNELGVYRDSTALSIGHDAFGRWVQEPEPFEQRPCPTPAELDVFWTLADPMWSLPGNDRMMEHYARVIDTHIHQQFMETYHPHGTHHRGHHSLVVRHGWPVAFRWDPTIASNDPLESDRVRLFYGQGQGFTLALDFAAAVQASGNAFHPREQDNESYAPAYGRVRPLSLQAGFFRQEGADMLIVRAESPGAAGRDRDWRVIGWDSVAFRRTVADEDANAVTGWLATPWRAQVVSVEAVDAAGAWRARAGIAPPKLTGGVAVSSVVLLAAVDTLVHTLDEVVPLMLPTTRVGAGRRVGLYWELYGADTVNAALELTVRSTREPGLLTRLIGGGTRPALQVRWEEALEMEGGRAVRTFSLDTEQLAPGEYRIELSLQLPDGRQLLSGSPLTVLER